MVEFLEDIEKNAVIRFSCPQKLAGRLDAIREAARLQNRKVNFDAALTAALEKLVKGAEKTLGIGAQSESKADAGTAPVAVPESAEETEKQQPGYWQPDSRA